MRLVLNDPNEVLDYRFCLWLISQLKHLYSNGVNPAKFHNIDNYLSTLDFMERHKNQTSDYIMRLGISNLTVNSLKGQYIIHINETIMFDSLQHIKLSTMCRLINYGTLSVKGYPILIDLFNQVAENIDMYVHYYYTYMNGG